MRVLLLIFISILTFQVLQAQEKTAKVNIDYLRDMVMPDYAEKEKGLARYMDSVRTALMNREEVKQWEQDIERATWVQRPGHEDEEKKKNDLEKAQMAREGIARLEVFFNNSYSMEYKKRFEPYLDMLDGIAEFKRNNSYDLVFHYGETGVTNISYRDLAHQDRMMNQIKRCIKIPEGLSQTEQQAEFNKQAKQCELQVMGPLWESSTDITEQIAQSLKK